MVLRHIKGVPTNLDSGVPSLDAMYRPTFPDIIAASPDTVANIPAAGEYVGQMYFATDGLKEAEIAASGTGCFAIWDGTLWVSIHTSLVVAA